VVFDFDGVLVETEESHYRAWAETYADFGLALARHEWSARVGAVDLDPLGELERRAGRRLAPAERVALQDRRRARRDALLLGQGACAGAHVAVGQCVALGLALAVASNSSHDWVATHLDRVGLRGPFAFLSCLDPGTPPKPAPDLYLRAVRGIGLAPGDCVAVEDSVHGLRAARAAGLRCVVVPSAMTGHQDFEQADLVLPALDALPWEAVVAALERDGGPG